MRAKPVVAAVVVVVVVAISACSSPPEASSETECRDVAKGRNCLTITEAGRDRYRVTETWVYTPDAPVVDGLAPVHRSEWIAAIDCETRGSQLEQVRFWDAQDREVTLSASDAAEVRRTLTANAVPPIVTAICDPTS